MFIIINKTTNTKIMWLHQCQLIPDELYDISNLYFKATMSEKIKFSSDWIRIQKNLNFRAVKMLLHFMKADNIMVDIFADLKPPVEAMSCHTVPAKPKTTIDAKYILFIFANLLMMNARTKEFALQKGTKPICFHFFIQNLYPTCKIPISLAA